MHINQDNYEQYFLDHTEGNLSPEMESELTDFLEANPDLKPILADFDASPLPFEDIKNESLKNRLKKNIHHTTHINEVNIDEWLIGDVEGLLDESGENELREFLELNPAYNFDYKIFSYTRLLPDLSISFRKKNELKKNLIPQPVFRLVWLLPAAAAMILLFIGIRFFRQPAVIYNPQVIQTEVQPVAEIPEPDQVEFDTELQKGLESRGTPAPALRHGSFRLTPSFAKAIVSTNLVENQLINPVTYNISPIITAEKKEKRLIAKVFSNLIAQAMDGIKNKTKMDNMSKPDFSFWSLAKAGIDGYNSLSDRDIQLYTRKDENGKVKSYALIDQKQLLWSKDLNKN